MDIKLKHNNLCSLKENNTVKEFLKKELLFSSGSIKKIITNKKLLNRGVSTREELKIPLDLLNQKFINPCYEGVDIEVISECDDFIVLNKPDGVHGHPLNYSENNTVLNFLRSHLNRAELGIASDEKERGLLYRLDEQTSGVLIYVKNPDLHKNLREGFNNHVKKKSYLAVVEGLLEINQDVHDYLKGSGEKGSKVICSANGVKCSSHIQTLRKDDQNNRTLVRVDLKTGFRHQIRVQLANLGHSIHGDELYGGIPAERIYLHAYEYCLGDRCWKASNNLLFSNLLNLNSLLDVS